MMWVPVVSSFIVGVNKFACALHQNVVIDSVEDSENWEYFAMNFPGVTLDWMAKQHFSGNPNRFSLQENPKSAHKSKESYWQSTNME